MVEQPGDKIGVVAIFYRLQKPGERMFGIVYQKHSVYGRVCEDLVGENHLRYIGKLPEQLFPRISALLVSDDNYFHTQQASMNKSYRKMKRREDYSKWINRA